MNESSKVLIIIGCSRSGTSFTASWITSCGLNIGENLMGSSDSNRKGHFEDLDFVNLHEKILEDNFTNYLVGNHKNLIVKSERIVDAKNIFEYKNRKNVQWGWKDPRTCLFLDMWTNIIPNPYFLVVFRNYTRVVDSHLIREIKIYENNKNFYFRVLGFILKRFKIYKNIRANVFLESWIRNNTEIIEFYKNSKSKDSFLFYDFQDALIKKNIIFEKLTYNWKFELSFKDPGDIFKPDLILNQTNKYKLKKSQLEKASNILLKMKELSNR